MTDITHIAGAPLSVGGGVARLAQGAPPPGPTQTYTVSVVDTLSAGARANVPFILGVPLRTGWAGNAAPFANTTLTARAGATPIPIGVGARCRDRDGNLTFAVIGGVLPSLPSGGATTVTVETAQGSGASGALITWNDVLAALNHASQPWTCTVEILIGSTTYTADPRTVSAANTTYSHAAPHYLGKFIDTPHLACFSMTVPFVSSGGARVNDKLRARFDVYAWKASPGPVDGGNPIIAILCDPEVEIASWNEAVSGTLVSAIRVRNHAGVAVAEWTGSIQLRAYAAADFNLRGVWWSNTAAERGGWDVVPTPDAQGRPAQHYATGHLLPTTATSAVFQAQLNAATTAVNGQSTVPMNYLGMHTSGQGGTGAREDICVIHRTEAMCAMEWTNPNRRALAHRNFSSALHQGMRFLVNGAWLDITGAQQSQHWTANRPDPTSGGELIQLDLAHHPMDGYWLYLVYGRLRYLRHMHFLHQKNWSMPNSGWGLRRQFLMQWQPRGMAWCLRTAAMTAAMTPEDFPATMGWTKALQNAFLDEQCGYAGYEHNDVGTWEGVNGGKAYTGMKAEYFDTARPGQITINNRYDNSPGSTTARFIFTGTGNVAPSFMYGYALLAMAATRRLRVLNADGEAWIDWTFKGFRDQMLTPYYDWAVTSYWGVKYGWGAAGVAPKTWARILAEASYFDRTAIRYGSNPGNHVKGITSYSLNAANPAAAVLTLNGANVVPYFDDGEQNHGGARGDWFRGAGAYAAWSGGVGAWVFRQIDFPEQIVWAGRITSVSADGRSCTIDCTVPNGVAPPGSETNNTETNRLRLPFWGPRSPWWQPNTIVRPSAADDYHAITLAAATTIASTSPPGDMGAIVANLKARLPLHGSPTLPLTNGQAWVEWALFGDWT
jgi:hypothetical protein